MWQTRPAERRWGEMAKLLVVEPDDQPTRRLRETFEQADYEVIEARTASEAVEVCQGENPDGGLLDPHLGRFLGITKGKWVAEETHRCGETPVVVLADEAEAKVLQEELGPDSVVALDASPDALIQAVSSLLPVSSDTGAVVERDGEAYILGVGRPMASS
ncbi:MAG: hypothetical protein CME19_13075 [Gemmatimonadetes bacterium]|nr:hypothetical protein [Gemmatimonadota bacterium]